MKLNRTLILILIVLPLFTFTSGTTASSNHIQNYSIITDFDLTTGLIAKWDFEELEGNEVIDRSEYELDGAIYGSQRAVGPMGTALEFDGIDDYVDILNDQSNTTHLSTTGDGTFSMWFRVDNIPVEDGIAPLFYYGGINPCSNMFDASNQGFIVEVGHSPVHRGSQRLYFTAFSDGCDFPSFCVDTYYPLIEGQWYHFAAVIEENYNTIYLNGDELTDRHYNFGKETSSEFFADAVAGETIWLGRGYWDSEFQYLDGAIDEIRVYDRPLNSSEIKGLYELSNLEYRTNETYLGEVTDHRTGSNCELCAGEVTTSETGQLNINSFSWVLTFSMILILIKEKH